MFQRPTQYKDLSNMRGGLNIPEHVKRLATFYPFHTYPSPLFMGE